MGSKDLDLNLLRVLDALLAERNVTRAAARLHVTQSAASHALARLRVALGDPLLVREGATMRVTAEGQRLAGEVHEIMRRVRTHIAPTQFDPATTPRSFVLAVPDALTVRVALPLFRRMSATAPLAGLHLHRLTADTPGALTRGAVDAAVSIQGYFPDSLRSTAVLRVRWQAIVRASHPLAGRPFTLAETVDWPHVAAVDSPTNERVERVLHAQGLRRTTGVMLNTAALVTAVVAEADVIGFIPEYEAVGDHIWTSDLGSDAPVLDYFLYWSAASEESAGHDWFLETVLGAVEA